MKKDDFPFIALFLITFAICYCGLARIYAPKPVSVKESYSSSSTQGYIEPVQSDYTAKDLIKIKKNNFEVVLTPLANYKITAAVMSKRSYNDNWDGKVVPVDLALAWGKLMEPEYQTEISYSQFNRWYYYRYTAKFQLDNGYIISHSANNHIVPANSNILRAVESVKNKQIITLEGFLINIDGVDSGKKVWRNTSLSRTDTGGGSCEILYVKKVVLDGKVYI